MTLHRLTLCWVCFHLWGGAPAVADVGGAVSPVQSVPSDIRHDLGLAPFYQKYIGVGGLAVVGSTVVSDYAVQEARFVVENMMAARPGLLEVMASEKVRLVVMACTEYTTDIPEHRHLAPAVFWDRRARGLGATPEAPAVSCAEENLLGYANDPYTEENILIHEFAHAVHLMGLGTADPTFDRRLLVAFERAREQGLWEETYAATNREEYWAEGVQSWFDDNRENDALHNQVNTRSELRAYDPGLAVLCEEVFGDRDWRYRKPAGRSPDQQRQHLAGYDPDQAPRFKWREYPIPDHPRVLIQTAIGDIELELDAAQAPITSRNFLRYVLEGFYSDGRFHRTVTLENQPQDAIKIQVIQASANPQRTGAFPSPIELEGTGETGLSHRSGTVSMARSGPNTAQDQFFICLSDQPELDAGGKRNTDGQGFAAFGRVVKGMDVARRIHGRPSESQTLMPPIPIQRAVRTK